MSTLDLSILASPVTFDERPVAVRGGDRLEWRVAALVLVLSRCRGRQTSIAAVHVLVWALSSSRARQMFAAWWLGRRNLVTTTFRFDPVVDQTIDVAVGSGLVEIRSSGKVRLTDAGSQLAEEMDRASGLLAREKEFLASLPGSLSEAEIRRRLGWEDLS